MDILIHADKSTSIYRKPTHTNPKNIKVDNYHDHLRICIQNLVFCPNMCIGVALRHHRYVLELIKSRNIIFGPKNIRNDNIHAYNKRNSQFSDFFWNCPTVAHGRGFLLHDAPLFIFGFTWIWILRSQMNLERPILYFYPSLQISPFQRA